VRLPFRHTGLSEGKEDTQIGYGSKERKKAKKPSLLLYRRTKVQGQRCGAPAIDPQRPGIGSPNLVRALEAVASQKSSEFHGQSNFDYAWITTWDAGLEWWN